MTPPSKPEPNGGAAKPSKSPTPLLQSVVDALSQPAAILAPSGAVCARNHAWTQIGDPQNFAVLCTAASSFLTQIFAKDTQDLIQGEVAPGGWKASTPPVFSARRLEGLPQEVALVTLQQNASLDQALIAAIEKMPYGMWLSDEQGSLSYINPHGLEFGAFTSVKEAVEEWPESIPEPHRNAIALELREHFTRREPFISEHPLRNRNGDVSWMMDFATPRFDASGAFLGYLGASFDITDRHLLAEHDHRASKQFQTAFVSAPISIVIMSDRGHFLAVNPTTCKILRISEDQLVGKSGNTITTPDSHADERRQVGLFQRGEIDEYQATRTLVRGDGTTFPGEMTASAVRDPDGTLQFIVVMTSDITDRVEAIERATQSEAAMRRLTDALPVVIAQIDPDLRYRFANETYRTWLGVEPAAMIGRSFKRVVGPKHFPTIRHHVENALDGREASFEWHRETRDGQKQHLYSQYVPNWDNDGKPHGFFAISFDITQRKEQEERIQVLNEELEERVRLRTLRLQNLNEELEAFCYSVSHDLRGPLRAMEGFAAMLVSDYSERLEGDGLGWLSRISAASKRGGRLIDELLNLSRVTRAEVRREKVSVSELAQRISGELAEADPTRRVSIEIEPGLEAFADPVLVADVLQNLLGNAWKFTARAQHPRIEVSRAIPLTNGDQELLRVRDNGVGFDMEFSDKLFSPFERLHAHGEFEGDGIGLATVHRIIQRHGGSVRAHSSPGQGASFDFSFNNDAPSANHPGRKSGSANDAE